MKVTLPLRFAVLATLTLTSCFLGRSPVKAASAFQEQALDQISVIAIARPYGEGKYDLLIIEQIPGKQECWTENGSNPVTIEPLLLKFDFTGICRRATDSNGYSIRLDGNDLGLDYLLRLVPRNGELVLVGTPRTGNYAEIVVGRTRGLAPGFMKVELDPGWQFSKRAFNGKALGHFYFSGSQTAIASASSGSPPSVTPTNTSGTPSVPANASASPFSDLSQNPYRSTIEQAVAMGIVSGFKDGTFRPQEPVTREQFLSMTIDAMGTVYKIDLDAQPQRSLPPFNDIEDSRWSAKKIQWAQWNLITLGNPNNTFGPTETITRSEIVDTLRRVAVHLKNQLNLPVDLQTTKTPVHFSDLSGRFDAAEITQMSGYCGVASPIGETGTKFNPKAPATRDYATAALLRTIECIKSEAKQPASQQEAGAPGSRGAEEKPHQ